MLHIQQSEIKRKTESLKISIREKDRQIAKLQILIEESQKKLNSA
jgi:hypothetical protein